jgi:hypothetical protein
MANNLMILNKIKATAHIVDVVAPASLENGHVVVLGAKGTDGTYTVAAPNAVTDEGMAIIADCGLSYEAEKTVNDRVIATGEVVRAYVPELGDVISIPVSNITATVAVAATKIVVPKASATKMECLNAFAGTEVMGFVVESVYTKNGISMAKLRCIRTQK